MLTNLQVGQSGNYFLQASNLLGAVNISNAVLQILPLPTCLKLASGMVGWWKGDYSTADVVATNNGILSNATYTSGLVGGAFSFDPENYSYGTYTGVKIADQPAYILTNSLTIEGWIRPRGNSYMIFFRGDNRPGLDPYSISMQNNNNVVFSISDAGGNGASVVTSMAYNQWTHLVATLDGAAGTLNFYTNGVLAAQTSTTVRPIGGIDRLIARRRHRQPE